MTSNASNTSDSSNSSSTPFWKLEADRQHFESVKRILGLQTRDDDEDDDDESDDDDDDDDEWEMMRQGVKSGQGWGRFRTDDNVER